jgi:hypothetical protein
MFQGVTPRYAWFCVTDPSIDVYDVTKCPFVWVAQFMMARELVIMPLWAFEKLAEEELPDPGSDGKEVIMVSNTARCGSTLLCQMFQKLPDTRSMSEPWATTLAHAYYVIGKLSHQGDEYEKILKSIIRLQCKNEVNRKIDRIFLKLSVWSAAQVS